MDRYDDLRGLSKRQLIGMIVNLESKLKDTASKDASQKEKPEPPKVRSLPY